MCVGMGLAFFKGGDRAYYKENLELHKFIVP